MTRLRVEPLEDRLAPAAGAFDPTFSGDGVQYLDSVQVSKVAAGLGGHVFALVGPASSLVRLTPDGTPDAAFGVGGSVAMSNASVVAPLADGGAYVGGYVEEFGGSFTLVRVTPTGTLDPTFGGGGRAVVPIPGGSVDAGLSAITIQSDGRILIAGSKTTNRIIVGQPPRYYDGVVARFTSDGQLDPTFGTGGAVLVNDASGRLTSVFARAVAVQPDGRIVVAADVSTTPRGVRGLRFFPAAARLTADGQLDPTFGAAGWSVVEFPDQTNSVVSAVRVLSDGRIMLAGGRIELAGDANRSAAAYRLTADGALDTTYGVGGRGVVSVFGTGYSAAIDFRGRAVFPTAGNSTVQSVSRLTPDGAADTQFGANGTVNLGGSLAGISLSSYADAATQLNGNILVGGGTAIVRLLGTDAAAGFVTPTTGAFTAGGPANGTVEVVNDLGGTYGLAGTLTAYAGFVGSVRSTTADVTGDGIPDIITAAGPGGPPAVTVIDGRTGTTAADFLGFEPAFTGGVFVAAADLDGDGRAEVIATPDEGGGPRVVVFSVAPGGAVTPRASFFGFDDPNFRGGARVAAADVNRDGTPDVAVAAGFLGGPRVVLFDGRTAIGTPQKLVGDFFAFPGTDAQTLRNGVYVAAGDVDGDGFADLIFGGGPGGAPRVFALSGALLTNNGPAAAQASPLSNFFVGGNATDRGGVTVAATGGAVAVGSGQGSAGRVRVYRTADMTNAAEPAAFQDVSVFGGAAVPGGVFVG